MPSMSSIGVRRTALAIGLGTLMAATVAGPVHAQGGDDTAGTLDQARQARDAARDRIDAIHDAIGVGCEALAPEACLINHIAVQLPAIGDELSGYADDLEDLDIPDVLRDDARTLISGLRTDVELLGAEATAAAAADEPALAEANNRRFAAAAELAAQLDPEWARAAFLAGFRPEVTASILAFAGDVTDEERAYLAAVRQVPRAAADDFACFGQAINRAYTSTDGLLAALVECNAGEAVAKNEAAARAIVPPERFIDENDWHLAAATEATRLDRLIGEAAAERDVVKFMVNNARLGNAFRPAPDLDPAFVRATGYGGVLDPTDPLAATDYGRGLFAVMVDYASLNPVATAFTAIEFPQVPRIEGLPAVLELAPELRAYDDEFRAAFDALEPPAELAADHAVIADFLQTARSLLDDLISAAEVGDADSTREIETIGSEAYCATATALSDEIRPAAEVFFDPSGVACR